MKSAIVPDADCLRSAGWLHCLSEFEYESPVGLMDLKALRQPTSSQRERGTLETRMVEYKDGPFQVRYPRVGPVTVSAVDGPHESTVQFKTFPHILEKPMDWEGICFQPGLFQYQSFR